MIRAGLLGLAVLLTPSTALACTWCVSSAFGDRTFNWPYLSLIIAPFLVAGAVAAVLMYHYSRVGARLRVATGRLFGYPARPRAAGGAPSAAHQLEKETT